MNKSLAQRIDDLKAYVPNRFAHPGIDIVARDVAKLRQALADLLEDTQHKDHDCGDTIDNCAVLRARYIYEKTGEQDRG